MREIEPSIMFFLFLCRTKIHGQSQKLIIHVSPYKSFTPWHLENCTKKPPTMEYCNAITLLLVLLIITLRLVRNSHKSKLPPGPKPWPIIGNIHLLGSKPHRSVADLAKTYGPLMSLRLGSTTTIVISSPNVAREMFLKHDIDFASRQIPDSAWAVDHAKFSMAWLPVCPKWREIRKISAIQLFTSQRLDASQGLRRKKVDELVEFVNHCCEKRVAVDIGRAAFTTTLNLLSNTFFSIDLSTHDSSGSQEFKDVAWHITQEVGRPNVSDFFPLVKALDLQGVRRSASTSFGKMLQVFDKIINERLRDQSNSKDDVLAILLSLVKQNELTLDDVRHMLIVSTIILSLANFPMHLRLYNFLAAIKS